jgi:hypothetical protein
MHLGQEMFALIAIWTTHASVRDTRSPSANAIPKSRGTSL